MAATRIRFGAAAMSEWRPYVGPELGMFEFTVQRRCVFEKKPAKKKGCARCGLPALHPDHLGLPPSINEAVGKDRMTYLRAKEAWHRVLGEGLVRCGLPRGLESVQVEMRVGVPIYREQDEGNRRWLVEKAFGDTLVGGYVRTRTVNKETVKELVIPGGWLVSDSAFPLVRYSMGAVTFEHTPGEASTTLTVFPSCEEPRRVPRHGEVPAEGLF
jgi:hypothetical protein